jgi:hypothetical protein
MKTGTHNLGANAFARATVARFHAGGVTIQQLPEGKPGAQVTLSVNQIELLKGILT